MSTDCFRCPLLPHEEHCPQRFEGEKAQKMFWAAFRNEEIKASPRLGHFFH